MGGKEAIEVVWPGLWGGASTPWKAGLEVENQSGKKAPPPAKRGLLGFGNSRFRVIIPTASSLVFEAIECVTIQEAPALNQLCPK
jgi:hypothetical protein